MRFCKRLDISLSQCRPSDSVANTSLGAALSLMDFCICALTLLDKGSSS